jgi:hypothetical protein
MGSGTDTNAGTPISLDADGDLKVGESKLVKGDASGNLPSSKLPSGVQAVTADATDGVLGVLSTLTIGGTAYTLPSMADVYTEEYALVGAGGTASFTLHSGVLFDIVHDGYGPLASLFNNILYSNTDAQLPNSELVHLLKGQNENNQELDFWFVGIEFSTAKIVTKYRIWGHPSGSSSGDDYGTSPKSWELRAAIDRLTYNYADPSTYTVLHSQTNATFSSYTTTEPVPASDNLSLANEYNLSTIGSYKYYVIHFTENYGSADYVAMSEIGLYGGGGFVLPSQVGNAGKYLKTDGTVLEWTDLSINNLSDVDTSANAPTDDQALINEARYWVVAGENADRNNNYTLHDEGNGWTTGTDNDGYTWAQGNYQNCKEIRDTNAFIDRFDTSLTYAFVADFVIPSTNSPWRYSSDVIVLQDPLSGSRSNHAVNFIYGDTGTNYGQTRGHLVYDNFYPGNNDTDATQSNNALMSDVSAYLGQKNLYVITIQPGSTYQIKSNFYMNGTFLQSVESNDVYIDNGTNANIIDSIKFGTTPNSNHSGGQSKFYGIAAWPRTLSYAELSQLTIPLLLKPRTNFVTTFPVSSAPTDGQALVYDSANSQWQPGDVAAPVQAHTDTQTGNEDYLSALTVEGTKYKIGTTLPGLTDVSDTTATDGQALVYDSANSQWQPGNVAASVQAHTDTQTGNEDYLSALTVEGTKYKIGTTLAGLTDVSDTTPQTGDSLNYDASLQLWQPSNSNRRNYQYKQQTSITHITTNITLNNFIDIEGFNGIDALQISTLQSDSKVRVHFILRGEVDTRSHEFNFALKRTINGNNTILNAPFNSGFTQSLSVVEQGHIDDDTYTSADTYEIYYIDTLPTNTPAGTNVTYVPQIARNEVGTSLFQLNRNRVMLSHNKENYISIGEAEEILTGPPLQVNSNVVPINPTNGHFIQWTGSAYTTASPTWPWFRMHIGSTYATPFNGTTSSVFPYSDQSSHNLFTYSNHQVTIPAGTYFFIASVGMSGPTYAGYVFFELHKSTTSGFTPDTADPSTTRLHRTISGGGGGGSTGTTYFTVATNFVFTVAETSYCKVTLQKGGSGTSNIFSMVNTNEGRGSGCHFIKIG